MTSERAPWSGSLQKMLRSLAEVPEILLREVRDVLLDVAAIDEHLTADLYGRHPASLMSKVALV